LLSSLLQEFQMIEDKTGEVTNNQTKEDLGL